MLVIALVNLQHATHIHGQFRGGEHGTDIFHGLAAAAAEHASFTRAHIHEDKICEGLGTAGLVRVPKSRRSLVSWHFEV